MLSHVQLFATLWSIAHKSPLSVGFSRQEYWNGLLFSPPGDLPNPGIKPASPALAGRFFTTEPPGKPKKEIFKQGTGRREIRKHEGLVCIYVLVHPTTQFLRHWQPPCQRGLKAFRRSTYSHVVCIWTKCLRFQNVTLLCILTTE